MRRLFHRTLLSPSIRLARPVTVIVTAIKRFGITRAHEQKKLMVPPQR